MMQRWARGLQMRQKSRVQAHQTLTGIKILYRRETVHEQTRLFRKRIAERGSFFTVTRAGRRSIPSSNLLYNCSGYADFEDSPRMPRGGICVQYSRGRPERDH